MNYDTFAAADPNCQRHTYSQEGIEITLYEDRRTRKFEGMIEVAKVGFSFDCAVSDLGRHNCPRDAANKLLGILKNQLEEIKL